MEFSVHNIFTPSSIAIENYVERKKINPKILSALDTPGKQLILYGHSGAGKSTILRKQLERKYEGEITTYCMSNLTFEALVLDAFDQMGIFFNKSKETTSSEKITSSIQSTYLGIKASIESAQTESNQINLERIVKIQLSPQRLADFIGICNYCWVLEDFHKMDEDEKIKLSQVMKVFMDKSRNYRSLKIIALGAVNSGREVVKYDKEMKRRISEIEVTLMSDAEIKEIITNGEKYLNISFTDELKKSIIRYSNGLASVCHSICLYICEESGIYHTVKGEVKKFGTKDLKKAMQRYLDEESDTCKDKFDKALKQNKSKWDNSQIILNALCHLNMDGGTHSDILRKIKTAESDYPPSNLSSYLNKLTKEEKGAIIRQDSSSGKYSFSESIYRTYALVLFDDGKIDMEHKRGSNDKYGAGSVVNLIGEIAFDLLKQELEKKYYNKKMLH